MEFAIFCNADKNSRNKDLTKDNKFCYTLNKPFFGYKIFILGGKDENGFSKINDKRMGGIA